MSVVVGPGAVRPRRSGESRGAAHLRRAATVRASSYGLATPPSTMTSMETIR